MVNGGSEPFEIRPGDRIAQMVFLPVYVAELDGRRELEPTDAAPGDLATRGSRAIVCIQLLS